MNQAARAARLLHTSFYGGLLATAALTLHPPAESRTQAIGFQDSPKAIVDEAWQLVNQSYVDKGFNKNDWQAVRTELLNREYSSKAEAYSAIRDALGRLQDPYTRFMDPEQFTALTTQTAGELSGIGITMEINTVTKVLTVIDPMPNSPATKAGLQSGDQILAIDGQTTRTLDISTASNMIRGKAGTPVKLRINRDGTRNFDLSIQREVVEFPTVTYKVKQEGSNTIGYIRLSEFSAHAADQFRRAIHTLSRENKVDAFILDLRGNPGGLLNASIDIARMWINDGDIVRTVDRDGHDETIQANRTAITQLPLVVLVDSNSASSSEILTGALQDNGRAVVVGSKTFGKALVQSVHQLSDGAGVAVTVAHYYTPKGTDISHKGITPDIQTQLNSEQLAQLVSQPDLVATKSDPQYSQAVRSVTKLIRTAQRNVEKPAITLHEGQKPAQATSQKN